MSGLFVFGVPLLTSFGIAGLSVVLLSMAAAVTLLPATMAVVGGRIKPSLPVPDAEGRFYQLARWVQHRPLKVAGAVGLLLVLLGLPFLSARFENGDARTLPRSSEVRATALALAERFPARGTDPVTVIASTDADDPAFVAWLADVSGADGVVGASTRPGTPPGITVVDLVPAGTSQGAPATAVVEQVRSHPRPSTPWVVWPEARSTSGS
jgi:RND superfamily putative drug exporter